MLSVAIFKDDGKSDFEPAVFYTLTSSVHPAGAGRYHSSIDVAVGFSFFHSGGGSIVNFEGILQNNVWD